MRFLVFVCLFAAANIAIAQGKSDGNAWHQICNSTDKSGDLMCGAFIAGFMAGVATQADFYKTERLFCLPSGVTALQATDVFSKFLVTHPEKRHFHSSTLASIALIEAFPCK